MSIYFNNYNEKNRETEDRIMTLEKENAKNWEGLKGEGTTKH